MFGNIGDLAGLMRNAGRMREMMEQATESLGRVQVEGTAGGGGVTARANGRLEIVSIRVDPQLVADGDVELLEDLVASAVNQALFKAREAAAQAMRAATGLPGLDGIFDPEGRGT